MWIHPQHDHNSPPPHPDVKSDGRISVAEAVACVEQMDFIVDGSLEDLLRSVVPAAVEVDRLSLNDAIKVSAKSVLELATNRPWTCRPTKCSVKCPRTRVCVRVPQVLQGAGTLEFILDCLHLFPLVFSQTQCIFDIRVCLAGWCRFLEVRGTLTLFTCACFCSSQVASAAKAQDKGSPVPKVRGFLLRWPAQCHLHSFYVRNGTNPGKA